METLTIFIKGKWFEQISLGEKTKEYRQVKPFWTSRLFDKAGKRIRYGKIEFINGMLTGARRMTTEFEGFREKDGVYIIKIGKIIKRTNFRAADVKTTRG